MKRCPECRRDYYDETLLYCLDDGRALLDGPASGDEPSTAILHDTARPGEEKTRSFDPVGTTATVSKRNSIIVGTIGIVLVTLLVIGSYSYFWRTSSKQIDSIAVMPFVNESGDADLEYLSDGMTETLINALMQLPNLNVQARSSVFRYKGKEVGAPAIGKELNVQAILNGRVLQRGEGLTLYLELVDAVTGRRIWGEQYDRKDSDLVTLQRDIARDVASKLQAKLTSADQQKLAKSYTSNSEAYQLYLQGRSYWEKRDRNNIEIAVGLYQQAIKIDPNYALAWAGLADAYAQPSQQPKGMPRAREAALKALSLDNTLPEAHNAQATVLARFDFDFAGAEREFRQALELNPNYGATHCRYGAILSNLSRFEAAEAEYRLGLELEPLSLVCNVGYGVMLTNARRYDAAVTQLKKALEVEENFLTHGALSQVYWITGNHAESILARARVMELGGNEQEAAQIRENFEKHGWVAFLRLMAEREQQGRGAGSYIAAKHYAALGEKDKAFAALNAAFEERHINFPQIKVDPLLDPLRDDPRYAELIKRVGFPE